MQLYQCVVINHQMHIMYHFRWFFALLCIISLAVTISANPLDEGTIDGSAMSTMYSVEATTPIIFATDKTVNPVTSVQATTETNGEDYVPRKSASMMVEMDNRTWQRKPNRIKLLNDVFQIPIQTLMAVNNLLQSFFGIHPPDDKHKHPNEILNTNELIAQFTKHK